MKTKKEDTIMFKKRICKSMKGLKYVYLQKTTVWISASHLFIFFNDNKLLPPAQEQVVVVFSTAPQNLT